MHQPAAQTGIGTRRPGSRSGNNLVEVVGLQAGASSEPSERRADQRDLSGLSSFGSPGQDVLLR